MSLEAALRTAATAVTQALEEPAEALQAREVGSIISVGKGIVQIKGLGSAQAEELLQFPAGLFGMAFNVDADKIGTIVLGDSRVLQVGMPVHRTHRVLDVPVGEAMLGRVINALGQPLDSRGRIATEQRRRVEQPAPAIIQRKAVQRPLQTGLKVVDALVPIGRGQRELILGDRQTGKTTLALDTIINQRDKNVVCIYCAIGQRIAAVAKTIALLRSHQAMAHTVVVMASAQDAPGLRFVAPYAATSIAEFFMANGSDVLIVYDDLTRHARAYRELSLLLFRPPGREGYPGDIFYVHSRLLERCTQLNDEHGGGSLSALPIIETQAQNIAAYIPTNLIGITDGQLYLAPNLFRKGQLPPIDVGQSVSRVGGNAQLPAYRSVASELRMQYTQFEELERFARFGTRLDQETQAKLERGKRVRQVLRQPQYHPIPVPEQLIVLLAAANGVLDELDEADISGAEAAIRAAGRQQAQGLFEKILAAEQLSDEDVSRLVEVARNACHGTATA